MAMMVHMEVHAKEGTGDDLVGAFADILPDTRAYEGFVDIAVYQSQDDKDNLVVIETWENVEAYERYIAWRK